MKPMRVWEFHDSSIYIPWVQVRREHSPVLLHPSLSQMSKALQGQSGAKPAQSGQSLADK